MHPYLTPKSLAAGKIKEIITLVKASPKEVKSKKNHKKC